VNRFTVMSPVPGQMKGHVRRGATLVGAFAAIVLFPAVVQGASTVFQVTNDTDRDAETSIAINPTDASNMVAGWISSGDRTCGFGVSDDGGAHWSGGVVPGIQLASGGSFDRGTDPSVAFDKFGNAYFSCLGFDLGPSSLGSAGTVFVSKSTNGGHSWGAPQPVFNSQAGPGESLGSFEDHQFLTANAKTGDLYVTETRFRGGGKPDILFSKSTDQNGSWTTPVAISDRGGNATFQHSFSAGGKEAGTVYVTYFAYPSARPDERRVYLAKSADDGAHFSEPQLVNTQLVSTSGGVPNIPGNLKVAVDQATNQIYLTYQDYDDGNGEVRVLRVADAGDHFVVQGRTTVKTDPADQFFPFITVAPNGRVDVCYQDRGYQPGNTLIFTTCGFSTDHALSFTNQQVTTVGFDASNNPFIGDYNWQASTNDAVYPIFVGDGAPGGDSNTEEVFVARVTP
jgi:hypothetical protein